MCIFVLQQLNKLHGTKFVISDGHTNITPCALPGWLPEDVVREVVLKFSNSLREELGRLQSLSQRRGRARTTDTGRISYDSVISAESVAYKGPKEADICQL